MKIIKNIKEFLIIFFICIILLVVLEIFSKILIDNNKLFFNEKPTRKYGKLTSLKNYYINDLLIGKWHKKNTETIHTSICFKAKYQTNSLGMRDEEVNYQNKDSYFIIGDSFAEGFGLNSYERIDANLKVKTLNLGLIDSGPINYYLIYDQFKEIPHEGIIVFIYPTNDFIDNNYLNLKKRNITFRQPYYDKNSPNKYTFIEPQEINELNKNFTILNNNMFNLLRKFIKENFYLYQLAKNFYFFFEPNYLLSVSDNYSGYFDSKIENQTESLTFVKKLIYKAKSKGVKNIVLVTIPSVVDIDRFNNNSLYLNDLLWYQTFSNYQGVEFIDLLKYFSKEKYHERYYFTCDHHFNSNGAAFVAQIINKKLDEKKSYKNQKMQTLQ